MAALTKFLVVPHPRLRCVRPGLTQVTRAQRSWRHARPLCRLASLRQVPELAKAHWPASRYPLLDAALPKPRVQRPTHAIRPGNLYEPVIAESAAAPVACLHATEYARGWAGMHKSYLEYFYFLIDQRGFVFTLKLRSFKSTKKATLPSGS